MCLEWLYGLCRGATLVSSATVRRRRWCGFYYSFIRMLTLESSGGKPSRVAGGIHSPAGVGNVDSDYDHALMSPEDFECSTATND